MRWKCDNVALESYVKFHSPRWCVTCHRWIWSLCKTIHLQPDMKYPFHQGLSLCQTSFSGYPVPLRAFELLNLVNSQPFSLIYRRRFLCLSSALLLACVFSQRLFAWPLLLRPDRLITTKLLGEIKTFLLYVKVFWTGFWALPSIVRLAFCVWDLCKTGCL